MSVSVLSSSPPDNSLLTELTETSSSATSSAAATSSASRTFETSTDSHATSALTADLTTLLKDLASGDVAGSKTALAKVSQDLKAKQASTAASGADSTSSASPLNKLLQDISSSLSSADTSGALKDLASFLVQTGQSSGNLVNTQA